MQCTLRIPFSLTTALPCVPCSFFAYTARDREDQENPMMHRGGECDRDQVRRHQSRNLLICRGRFQPIWSSGPLPVDKQLQGCAQQKTRASNAGGYGYRTRCVDLPVTDSEVSGGRMRVSRYMVGECVCYRIYSCAPGVLTRVSGRERYTPARAFYWCNVQVDINLWACCDSCQNHRERR